MSKAQGVPGKEAAARQIEVQVAEAQRDADRDRAELERVTRSTLAEAARFRRVFFSFWFMVSVHLV